MDAGDLDRSNLASALPSWDWFDRTPAGEIPNRVKTAHAVLANKCSIDRKTIEAAPGLKLIALAATGTDNVDTQAATERGIAVCNIRDYCTDSVAQHVLALMFSLLTGLPWYVKQVMAGDWSRAEEFCLKDRPIREARGLCLGVIGYGTLGRRTAEMAAALGMEVKVAERRGQAPRPGRVPFDEVIQQADVFSIHCPLTEETRGLIDRNVLQAMKSDALLINTARGKVIVEEDLAEALRQGEIAGAGLDTLSVEPPPDDHPLLNPDIPNLIVTPHNAWASRTARQAALDQLALILRVFQEGRPMNVVNGVAL